MDIEDKDRRIDSADGLYMNCVHSYFMYRVLCSSVSSFVIEYIDFVLMALVEFTTFHP